MMNKRILFICELVPVDYFKIDHRISIAGNNFQWKVIEMLFIESCIAMTPLVVREKIIHTNNRDIVVVNNNSILPYYFHRYYRGILDIIVVLFNISRSPINTVFFYNVDKRNFFIIFLTKYIFRREVFVILADIESKKARSSLFVKSSYWLLSKINGVLALNSNLKVNRNQQIINGLLRDEEINYKYNNPMSRNIIFSGSIGLTTGIVIALKAIGLLDDCKLYVTGKPFELSHNSLVKLIAESKNVHDNIVYLGLLSTEDYYEVLDECTIALSLRNPKDSDHENNFPSKIIEYLSRGKLVISTVRYQEISDDVISYCDFDPISVASTIKELLNSDEEVLSKRRNSGLKYVRTSYSKESFSDKVYKLMNIEN